MEIGKKNININININRFKHTKDDEYLDPKRTDANLHKTSLLVGENSAERENKKQRVLVFDDNLTELEFNMIQIYECP